MRTYKQLTHEQRCQIEALEKSGLSQQSIAEFVGTTQSTISRELRPNRGQRGYRHKQAHRLAMARRLGAAKSVKMTPEMVRRVEQKLRENWSPEQISGWLATERGESLSHERIYLRVWSDKCAGGDLHAHLRRSGKAYQKRRNGKRPQGRIRNRIGIEDRPSVVDEKSRVGDWEIDTVIGKSHRGALVTVVERATQFTLVAKVANKSDSAVTAATIELLRPYKGALHTITADNGKEFAYREQLTAELGPPYTSLDPTIPGNADSTRTRIVCYGNIGLNVRTSRRSQPGRSTRMCVNSTSDHERPSASNRLRH
jgi:IS30 family transposase